MQIIGDRHYRTIPGEVVTFSDAGSIAVGGIAVGGAPATTLPISLPGAVHSAVTVTVGFTGPGGGSADIAVRGSLGGIDVSKIRQIDGLPFRSVIFIVD